MTPQWKRSSLRFRSASRRVTQHEQRTLYGLLRKLVGLRDGDRCLRCGDTEALQLSHIYPRGKYGRMEFLPENLKLLCASCHLGFWHLKPKEGWKWLEGVISPDRLSYLKEMANSIIKTPFSYKTEKERLEQEIQSLVREYEDHQD